MNISKNGYGSCEITDLIDSPLISPIAKLLEVCRQISNWNWRETEKYLRYPYYWWIPSSQNGCTQPCSVCIIYLLCLYSCSICSCSSLFSVWLPSTFVISSTIIHPSASFLPSQSLYVAMGESLCAQETANPTLCQLISFCSPSYSYTSRYSFKVQTALPCCV